MWPTQPVPDGPRPPPSRDPELSAIRGWRDLKLLLDRRRPVEQGLVTMAVAGPTHLDRLNREHLAAPGIVSPVQVKHQRRHRVAALVHGWSVPAQACEPGRRAEGSAQDWQEPEAGPVTSRPVTFTSATRQGRMRKAERLLLAAETIAEVLDQQDDPTSARPRCPSACTPA